MSWRRRPSWHTRALPNTSAARSHSRSTSGPVNTPPTAATRLMSAVAAYHAGDHAVAESMLLRMQAASVYREDLRWFSMELAEVLGAAGRFEEAIVYYDRLLSAWKDHIVAMAGAHNNDGTEAVSRALRGRAAALAALHRDGESQRDLDRAGLVAMLRIGVITSEEYEDLTIPGWMLSKIRRREAERTRRIRSGR